MRNGKMCIFGFFLLFCLGWIHIGTAQLNPTRQRAVVTFVMTNPLNQTAWPQKSFVVQQAGTLKRWELTTDEQGTAAVLLPIGEDYVLHLPDWEHFAQISIPKEPFSRQQFPIPYYDLENLVPGTLSIPVYIQLIDSSGKASPLEEQVLIRGNCGKGPYQTTTNKDGMATLELPIGCQYVLNLPNAPHYYKFDLPNKPYANWTETVLFERLPGRDKYASINKALINFVFTDLEGTRVEGELFWLVDVASGQRYEGRTNAWGIAQILVPLHRQYSQQPPFCKLRDSFSSRSRYFSRNDLLPIYYQCGLGAASKRTGPPRARTRLYSTGTSTVASGAPRFHQKQSF